MQQLKDKDKPKKLKALKPSKIKKQLWQLCREIIFKRYGNVCYTCSNRVEGVSRHCGHFITKSTCSMEMAYSLDNLRPQCFSCNIWKSGNWVAYEAHLKRDGIDVEELKQRNEQTKGRKYDIIWLLNKLEEYKIINEKERNRG